MEETPVPFTSSHSFRLLTTISVPQFWILRRAANEWNSCQMKHDFLSIDISIEFSGIFLLVNGNAPRLHKIPPYLCKADTIVDLSWYRSPFSLSFKISIVYTSAILIQEETSLGTKLFLKRLAAKFLQVCTRLRPQSLKFLSQAPTDSRQIINLLGSWKKKEKKSDENNKGYRLKRT